MEPTAASNRPAPAAADLPATAYPHHHRLFKTADKSTPTGLLFDNRTYAIMAITHPPDSETPDLNSDTDGDRVLVLLDGDLALQIGENRFLMQAGDAVQIPRGVCFGRSRSQAGAHMLLIRSKALRSFSIHR